jgi:hypothetical protein
VDPAKFWRTAYGPDPRGNNPILTETRANCPTLIRRFGRMQKDDRITADLLNQLYAADNEMTDRAGEAFWDRASPNQKDTGMVLIDEPYSQEKLQDAIVAAWAAATAIPTDAFLIQLPFAEVTFDTQIQGHADATWFDAVIANAPTTRIAAAADAYAYTSTDANDYGIYGRLDVPLGALDRWQNFRAHGSGALYRRWSKLATLAAGIHPDDQRAGRRPRRRGQSPELPDRLAPAVRGRVPLHRSVGRLERRQAERHGRPRARQRPALRRRGWIQLPRQRAGPAAAVAGRGNERPGGLGTLTCIAESP